MSGQNPTGEPSRTQILDQLGDVPGVGRQVDRRRLERVDPLDQAGEIRGSGGELEYFRYFATVAGELWWGTCTGSQRSLL